MELQMSFDERIRFMKKLNMLYITVHNIDYERQEEMRGRMTH